MVVALYIPLTFPKQTDLSISSVHQLLRQLLVVLGPPSFDKNEKAQENKKGLNQPL